ncbi:MAG: ABC transporter ATP-binding protein [Lachnospiraceae bacterium]|nr:ABC transporter ATP-binding protein [Lachnospiraceae bacterium]
MIEVKNLVKMYGNHLAVDDISFTLEPGRVYGFLGPNGAGKSTTMNIMTGYIAPTSGEIIINDHNIMDEPEEAKACMGYLPEMPPLYNDMKVYEYLKFVAGLKHIKRSERKAAIEEVMQVTGITEYQNRLISSLSKGYKQRVGLAQAIIAKPEIIILDEPTVGLDPRQIIEIRDLIRSLGKKHTVILSSHIFQEISAVCDYIIIIARGHLIASDTPANLINKYASDKELTLKVRGNLGDVTSTLNRIEDAINVRTTPSFVENDCIDVTLNTRDNKDIREDIFNAFAEDGLPILELKSSDPSLEDIFLELTAREEEEAIRREEKEMVDRFSSYETVKDDEFDEGGEA